MATKIYKNKLFYTISEFLSVMVCVIIALSFSYPVNAKSQWDRMSNMQKNTCIEKIAEDNANSKNKTIIMTEREVHQFFNTTNTNALIGKSEEEIKEYFSKMSCGKTAPDNEKEGLITDPVTYLHNTVAKSTDSYTVTTTKKISDVGTKTCDDLGGHENCTLTALYNIMVYYRSQGYQKIPTTQSKLYNVIKAEASELGYDYNKNKDLPVTKNNNLVTNVWQKGKSKTGGFGYTSGSGSNNYLWTQSTAINLIDNNKPFMFSLASGRYYDHTVTVYGYKIYKNKRTGKKYTFLMLRDGWSSGVRYLAWTNTPESYVACLTSVTPPKTKK